MKDKPEPLMTYDDWLELYKLKKVDLHYHVMYMVMQKLLGVAFLVIAWSISNLIPEAGIMSVFMIILGLFVLITKEKIVNV